MYLSNTLQCAAMHCNTLQHATTHCNTLQHTATHCNTAARRNWREITACRCLTHCNALQHITTHCNTLQHTATHCNTLQHTASHCNTLQHTATHCNSAARRNRLEITACRCLSSAPLRHASLCLRGYGFFFSDSFFGDFFGCNFCERFCFGDPFVEITTCMFLSSASINRTSPYLRSFFPQYFFSAREFLFISSFFPCVFLTVFVVTVFWSAFFFCMFLTIIVATVFCCT